MNRSICVSRRSLLIVTLLLEAAYGRAQNKRIDSLQKSGYSIISELKKLKLKAYTNNYFGKFRTELNSNRVFNGKTVFLRSKILSESDLLIYNH